MKFSPYILIVILPTLLFGQLPESLIQKNDQVYLFDEYNGSIYLTDRYKKATVIDEQSGSIDTKLKYNIYLDAMEYRYDSKFYSVLKKPIVHIRIMDHMFYYCNFQTARGLDRSGYYALVESQEKYRIYKQYTLKITEPKKGSGSSYGVDPGTIKRITTYYLEENNVILNLSQDKVKLLETFRDKENELAVYLKTKKIRLKKEEDLVQLVAKYVALKNIDNDNSKNLLSDINKNQMLQKE